MNGARESAAQRRRRRLFFAPRDKDDESSHALRQAIGYLGLFLPFLVWILARWRSVDGFPGQQPLDSISEYYHSGAVAVFTGALTVLAMFLWTYRGFDNAAGKWDRRLGKVAAFAALGVSLMPTKAISPFPSPLWWKDWMGKVHYSMAVLMFATFIAYSWFLFPKKGAAPDARKLRRNAIYRFCGITMTLCLVWAGYEITQDGPIFWPETLALVLFGWSWLTKGRAGWTLLAMGRQARKKLRSAGR